MWIPVIQFTSLNNNSLLCCFRRSIFLTATWAPVLVWVAIHTIPVDPSPILMKLSKSSLGSPGLTTICNAARNCNEENTSSKIRNKIIQLHVYAHLNECKWCYLQKFLIPQYMLYSIYNHVKIPRPPNLSYKNAFTSSMVIKTFI